MRTSVPRWTVLPAVVLSAFAAGCAGRADRAAMREFPLAVLFAGPPRLATSPAVPEELVQLALPMEDPGCGGVAFLPKLQAVRLDLPDAPQVPLGGVPHGDWIASVQDFYGQHNLARVRRDIELAVRKQALPAELLKAAATNHPVGDDLSTYIRTLSIRRLFVLEERPGTWPASVESAAVTVSKTTEELIGKLASALCDEDKRKEEPSAVAVLFKPPAGALGNRLPVRAAKAEGDGEEQATAVRQAAHTTDRHDVPSVEGDPAEAVPSGQTEADRRFATLDEKALSGSVLDRRQLDEQLKAAQKEFPHDYRFPYLRAELAVYGRGEHHEAFAQLFHAAEVAIVNDDASVMLSDVMRDAAEGGSLHRLSHGHGEWQTLTSALKTGNVALVRR